jgi:hypothetical protein
MIKGPWHLGTAAMVLGLASTPPISAGMDAAITVTCDNDYALYLNGSLVGVQNNADGSWGWDAPEVWPVELLPVENVVAVRGLDHCC